MYKAAFGWASVTGTFHSDPGPREVSVESPPLLKDSWKTREVLFFRLKTLLRTSSLPPLLLTRILTSARGTSVSFITGPGVTGSGLPPERGPGGTIIKPDSWSAAYLLACLEDWDLPESLPPDMEIYAYAYVYMYIRIYIYVYIYIYLYIYLGNLKYGSIESYLT
jgi:hypothetical protein